MPEHATGSRAPDPDEIASVEKNLRDEVRRRLGDATPDRAAIVEEAFQAVLRARAACSGQYPEADYLVSAQREIERAAMRIADRRA